MSTYFKQFLSQNLLQNFNERLLLHMKNQIISYSKMFITYFDKITDNIEHLTTTDIDIILMLSLNQDGIGRVQGFHHFYVCNELHITKQTFYNSLNNLTKLGFITEHNSHKGFKTIINNYNNVTFCLKNKIRYIDINRKFLFSDEFRNLKKNAKYLCIYLLFNSCTQFTEKNFNILLETIGNKIGVKTLQILQGYVNSIKNFFNSVTRINKDKKEKVKFLNNFKNKENVLEKAKKSDRYCFLENMLLYISRRNKIIVTDKYIKDLVGMQAQFSKKRSVQEFLNIVNTLFTKEKRRVDLPYLNCFLSGKYKLQEIFPV